MSGAVAGRRPCRGRWGLVPGVGAGRAAAGDVPASVGSLELRAPRRVSPRRREKGGRSRLQGRRAEGRSRDSQVGPQRGQDSATAPLQGSSKDGASTLPPLLAHLLSTEERLRMAAASQGLCAERDAGQGEPRPELL